MSENGGVSLLLVGDFAGDRLLVHDLCRYRGWKLFESRDRKRAIACLERHPVQVVIAESDIPRWNWKRVLQDLRNLPNPPQLVVASRTADDYLWSEVLNIGGYDVLPQPLRRDELDRVISAAKRHYERPKPAHQAGPVSSTHIA